MWKFRPIGEYYELLVDDNSIYSCRKQDTIIQAMLEDLCNRHNQAINELIEETNKEGNYAYDDGYDNGYEDGKEEGYRQGYEEGYNDGLADAVACEGF